MSSTSCFISDCIWFWYWTANYMGIKYDT